MIQQMSAISASSKAPFLGACSWHPATSHFASTAINGFQFERPMPPTSWSKLLEIATKTSVITPGSN
jgi:hypothetical protein